MNLSSIIAKARAERGWKVEKLAGEAGVSLATVRRLEAGKHIRAEHLESILAALGKRLEVADAR